MTEEAEDLQSARLRALRDAVNGGDETAVAAFWDEVAATHTPLVEPDPERADVRLVTFLYRATEPVENVVLIHGMLPEQPAKARFARLDGTDVWYKTLRLRSNLRAYYNFLVNDPLVEPKDEAEWHERTKRWRTDPLNPDIVEPKPIAPPTDPYFPVTSLLTLPDAVPQPWFGTRPDVPAGTVAHHRFSSRLLGNERDIWLYVPPKSDASEPHHLLVLFDGDWVQAWMDVPATLDNLIAAGLMPPTVAVMVGNVERDVELSCHPPFARFLAEELVPWARSLQPIATERTKVIVGGVSRGGLAAAYCGLERPDVFGNVLSQSGSFWWKPDPQNQAAPVVPGDAPEYGWLMTQFAWRPRVPVRFYVDIGRLEYDNDTWDRGPGQVDCNRWLRDVLTAKGYDLTYREFGGGHEFQSWRGTFADGLIALHERARRSAPGSQDF